MCMLHAFHKRVTTALGKSIPLDKITTNLRKKLQKVKQITKVINHLVMILSTSL